MKFTKKCPNTQSNQKDINNNLFNLLYKRRTRRRSSADRLYTSSSVSAVTSLILIFMLTLGLCGIINLLNTNNTSAAGSVSLTVSSDTVSLDIAPTRATGSFAKSDNINISASTTNSTGYTLSLAASNSTDYDKLKNTTTNTALTSISSATTEEAFKSLSGTAYNGMWGYLPSKYNSSTNTDFLPAPTMGGDILDKTTTANTTTNNYTLAIGARVDSSTKLGTYSNTYNVILVSNETPYTITFNDSVVTNMPTDINSASSASSVDIPSTIPERDGYEFAGWCTNMPTGSGNDLDQCSGTIYNPDGDGTNLAWGLGASDNNLNLYAMWKATAPAVPGLCTDAATCMQTATLASCGQSMTDSRDGYKYTTALIDGKCWMTTNLNLGSNSSMSLSASDTNITSNYTLPASTTGWGYNSSDASESLYKSNSTTCDSNKNIGCFAYYSYATATAGINPSTNSNAYGDICPKGWRLPTYSEVDNFRNNHNYSFFTNEFGGVLSGIYDQQVYPGSISMLWTSTAYDSDTAYYQAYTSSGDTIVSHSSKRYGRSIRCIKKTDDYTMQSVTDNQLSTAAPNNGDSVYLEDERDGQVYSVAKLNDNYWMTRNLAIGCNGSGTTYGSSANSKSLTISNSNVFNAWSTPTALLSTSANSSSTSGYTTAAIQCDNTYGAWYNYAAVSAGTITGSTNTADAVYDICPKGWRLPTNSEITGITSSGSSFSPIAGGRYSSGTLGSTTSGFWWTATSASNTNRNRLGWNGSSLNTGTGGNRYYGFYARCVRK